MSQITLGGLTTMNLATHLDLMFNDLYGYAKNLVSDGSGNVGIGTSAPLQKLDVAGTSIVLSSSGSVVVSLSQNISAFGYTGPGVYSTGVGLGFHVAAAVPIQFGINNVEKLRIDSSGNTRPGSNNAYTLGSASFGWSNIYAQNALTVLSDARTKTDISDASLGLDFIKSLRPVSYKFRVGRNEVSSVEDGTEIVEVSPTSIDERGIFRPAVTEQRTKYRQVVTPIPGNRTHWGLIAQEVKAAVDAAGVDFGGWVLADTADPESTQALRYEQFIAPLIKAVQQLHAQLEAQSARVAALEAR